MGDVKERRIIRRVDTHVERAGVVEIRVNVTVRRGPPLGGHWALGRSLEFDPPVTEAKAQAEAELVLAGLLELVETQPEDLSCPEELGGTEGAG